MDIKSEMVADMQRLAQIYPTEMISSVSMLHAVLMSSRQGALMSDSSGALGTIVELAHLHMIEAATTWAHYQGWDLDQYRACFKDFVKHTDTLTHLLRTPDDAAVNAALAEGSPLAGHSLGRGSDNSSKAPGAK